MVGLLDLVPLLSFAAEAKDRHQVANDLSDAAVVVRLSSQDDLFCLTYFIWTLVASAFFLSCVQVDAKFVAVTKILVPREED